MSLIEEFPSRLKSINDGKGIPMQVRFLFCWINIWPGMAVVCDDLTITYQGKLVRKTAFGSYVPFSVKLKFPSNFYMHQLNLSSMRGERLKKCITSDI